MISQSLSAVILPAGTGPGGMLQASIYLTPRLSGAQRLSDFPDWLGWTGLVRQHGMSFALSCGGATVTVAADTTPLRPDAWNAIFGHDSLVSDYSMPDFSQRLLVSYPSREAAEFIRYAYLSAATATNPAANGRQLQDLLSDLVFRDDGQSNLTAVLSNLRVTLWDAQHSVLEEEPAPPSPAPPPAQAPAPAVVAPPLSAPSGTRAMAEQFALYNRLPSAPTRKALPGTAAELAALIDFHQALTALAAHPSLLAATGLALTVQIPGSLCPASPSSGDYLTVQVTEVQPGWAWSLPPTLALPATAYTRGTGTFAAAPATAPGPLAAGTVEPGDILNGFLALTSADYQLIGVDLDGAMLKAMALADSLANAEDATLADGLLAALRSSGISLLADNRAQQVLQAIQNNQALNATLSGQSAPPLTARDLTRGYRLDVYCDLTGTWHSLHRRDATYRLGGGSVVIKADDEEGFTQLAVVQPADDPNRPVDPVAEAANIPQPGTDLYVNERIARWNNWSLSAPRPGTALNRSPDPARALDPDPTAGQAVTTFDMTTSFAAHPGSLPTLRFGGRYRMRARAVDLAGQGPALTASAPDSVIAPAGGDLLPYFRYEPVPHPVLVLRSVPAAGGSLAQLVIRSYNSDPSLDTVPTTATDERFIAPPRASVQMVEHHGLLDDSAGRPRGDLATYQAIVARDRAQLPAVGSNPIEPGLELPILYYPDPLARGAALAGLPQTAPNSDGTVTAGALVYTAGSAVDARPGSVTHVPFAGVWPDLAAFRIRLAEGQEPPAWDEPGRLLTVLLAKGQEAQIALSSYLHPADLDLLGVWDWLRVLFEQTEAFELQNPDPGSQLVGSTANRGLLTRMVLDGANEFITPSLPVTLTHAVQQPLGLPTWTRLPIVHDPASPVDAAFLANSFSPVTAWRSLGSHHAVLLGALQISGATTAKVDLEAVWIEWNDDLSQPGPTQTQSSSHVERIELGSLTAAMIPADGSDSRQVAVYVPQIDTLWFAAPFDTLDGVLPPSQLAAPVHQLGDTKHRMIRYRAVSSSRFQEYFPEPGLVTTRTGASLTVDVPSSARPLPPDVDYVVPTFGWHHQVTTNTKTDVRRGNGLRVYLQRPWYSSGPAELLGVVLWPGQAGQSANPPPTDAQREGCKTIITQWGLDPIWATGSLIPIPATSTFPAAVRTAASLSLEESAQLVDVAGHQVGFDAGRQLWYCDIEFDNPTAYAPFVRLALARYQPHSIPGVELSHVVLADFAQLTPDRSAALTVDPADPTSARLVVAGLAPAGPTSSYITATVQARQPGVAGDLGWQPAAPADARVTEDSPAPNEPDSVLFAGTVRFARRPPPGQFRLVVQEFEILPVDPPPASASDKPEYGSRLVYASILPFDYPLNVEAEANQA
jgi:hypothetical protein